jgi:hypothetical protein
VTTEQDHNTTIVSITGIDKERLHILSNLYCEPFDSESVLSVVSKLAHNPGGVCDTYYSTETWCTSMDQSTGGTLFVVSMEGEMHVSKGNKWIILDLECPDGLNSVWASNDDEAFAVGLNGERVRVIGQTVSVDRDPEPRRLNAIHGTSSANVYAVGDNGVIMNYDGTIWKDLHFPTNVNLLAVLCNSENEVYVGGSRGTLLKWNGVQWEALESPEITITSLALFKGDLYVSAGRDGVYILGKNGLEPFKDLLIYRLKTIGNILFGIGNRLVAQFDGVGWWGGDLNI